MTRPDPGPTRSLRVRSFEYANTADRIARRRAARPVYVDPVRCPQDGTPLMPGQVCTTCAAVETYGDAPYRVPPTA